MSFLITLYPEKGRSQPQSINCQISYANKILQQHLDPKLSLKNTLGRCYSAGSCTGLTPLKVREGQAKQ